MIMNNNSISIYIDFKSPYSYLAIEPSKKFAKDLKLEINWLPYVLDIPEYLGSAKVDNKGKVLESSRNDHQWRRVRYSYMNFWKRELDIENFDIVETIIEKCGISKSGF